MGEIYYQKRKNAVDVEVFGVRKFTIYNDGLITHIARKIDTDSANKYIYSDRYITVVLKDNGDFEIINKIVQREDLVNMCKDGVQSIIYKVIDTKVYLIQQYGEDCVCYHANGDVFTIFTDRYGVDDYRLAIYQIHSSTINRYELFANTINAFCDDMENRFEEYTLYELHRMINKLELLSTSLFEPEIINIKWDYVTFEEIPKILRGIASTYMKKAKE